MNTYKTAEIAAIIGIHPNTVRLYEDWKLIPKPKRQPNGYRIFTDLHIDQFRLARLAFQIEVLQNGLRKKIVNMIKVSAAGDFDTAIILTQEYLTQVRQECANAEEAIEIVKEILADNIEVKTTSIEAKTTSTEVKIISIEENITLLKRKEVSKYLNISMDTLRNWEMNGLLTVKRKQNGYRIYTNEDIRRLKVIRSLRCANYSLEAILRMLKKISKNPNADIKKALNTPEKDEDIITACDRLITSLLTAEEDAKKMICHLKKMKQKYL